MPKSRIPQAQNFYRKGKRVLVAHRKKKSVSRASNSVIIKFTKTELLIVHDLVLKEINDNPKRNTEELLNIELKTS